MEKLEENEAVAKSMLSHWLDKWQEAHDIMRVSGTSPQFCIMVDNIGCNEVEQPYTVT